jgi:DNA-binding MarR family transcriptional regulator
VSRHHTLTETEHAVRARLGALPLDLDAMAAVSNIYRASTVIRHHLEESVLRTVDLTWTGFVVLWVLWVWGEMPSGDVAAEAGITKGTLTGVVKTLRGRGLVERRSDPGDGRVVRLLLTRAGEDLMAGLFPAFNKEETFVCDALRGDDIRRLGDSLRTVVMHVERDGEDRRSELRADAPPTRRSGGRQKAR